MSEVSYYQDESVTVTNARAVLSGSTYAMSNITSVSMGKTPANRMAGIVIAVLGFIGGVFVGAISEQLLFTLLGFLALFGGIALAVMAKPSYIVRIGSASGEAEGLVSKDKDYIMKIIKAMNEAIIKRG
jgi:hypothetical protein